MGTFEYPLHRKGRIASYITAAFLFVFPPLAIWIAARTALSKVVVSLTGVVAKGLLTTEFAYADVARLGTCSAEILLDEATGWLARERAGGSHYVWIVVKLKDGRTRKFVASYYDRHEEMMAKISERLGRPYEALTLVPLRGMQWPGA